jgi:transposase-like protein
MSDESYNYDIDSTEEAIEQCRLAIIEILKIRLGLTDKQAMQVLDGHISAFTQSELEPEIADSEKVARWLRRELAELRKEEKILGAAPILNDNKLSRPVISDMAMTMLEKIGVPPGPELLALLKELLNVDRHRRTLTKAKNPKKNAAIYMEVYEPGLSDRQLAKKVGVAHSTISAWRRDPDFKRRVKFYDELKELGPDNLHLAVKSN